MRSMVFRVAPVTLLLVIILLSGCGSDRQNRDSDIAKIQGGSVVSVIKRSGLDRAEQIIGNARRLPGMPRGDYKACLSIAQSPIPGLTVRSFCRQRQEQLKKSALVTLIENAWIFNEADNRSVRLSRSDKRTIAASQSPDQARAQILLRRLAGKERPRRLRDVDLKPLARQFPDLVRDPGGMKAVLFVTKDQPAAERIVSSLNRGRAVDWIKAREKNNLAPGEKQGVVTIKNPSYGGRLGPPPEATDRLILSLRTNRTVGPQIIGDYFVVAKALRPLPPKKLSPAARQRALRQAAIDNYRSAREIKRLRAKWRKRTLCLPRLFLPVVCGGRL